MKPNPPKQSHVVFAAYRSRDSALSGNENSSGPRIELAAGYKTDLTAAGHLVFTGDGTRRNPDPQRQCGGVAAK